MAGVRLDYVESLLREISNSLVPGVPDALDGMWMSRPGQGSVFLSKQETASYTDVISRLAKAYGRHGTPSADEIGRALNDAIFTVLDLERTSDEGLEKRVRRALIVLRDALQRPSEPFTCYVPLEGVAAEGLPARIGDVRLVRFNSSQVRRILNAANRSAPSRDANTQRRRLLNHLRRTDSWGQAAAVVTVNAHDFKAASQLADEKTRQVVDVLNFFADLVPYQNGWVYFPGDATSRKTGAVVLRHDGVLSTPFTAVGPLQPYSIARLRKARSLRASLQRVSSWMRGANHPGLSSVLLTALRWAGRASVESRREQAFLLFAIALETAVLPGSDSRELVYQLRVRVAHILGGTPADRSRISGDVKRLYDTRSKIVHNGSYAVADGDLGLVRRVAKTAIIKLMTGREFKTLSTVKDLNMWFEERAFN